MGAELAAAGLLFWYESTLLELTEHYVRVISDAFFVPGIITLCFGLILFAANGGGLYAVGYLWKKLGQKLSRGRKQIPEYYEYVEEKRAKGKIQISHLFIGAGIFIAAGVIFAVIYG